MKTSLASRRSKLSSFILPLLVCVGVTTPLVGTPQNEEARLRVLSTLEKNTKIRVDQLVKALTENNSPREQARFMELLEANGENFELILNEWRARAAQDPGFLSTAKLRLEDIEKSYRDSPATFPNMAAYRWFTLLLTYMGWKGAGLSYWHANADRLSGDVLLDRAVDIAFAIKFVQWLLEDIVIWVREMKSISSYRGSKALAAKMIDGLRDKVEEEILKLPGDPQSSQQKQVLRVPVRRSFYLNRKLSDLKLQMRGIVSEYFRLDRFHNVIDRNLRRMTPLQVKELAQTLALENSVDERSVNLERLIRNRVQEWLRTHPEQGVNSLLKSSFEREEIYETRQKSIHSFPALTVYAGFIAGVLLTFYDYSLAIGPQPVPAIETFVEEIVRHLPLSIIADACKLGGVVALSVFFLFDLKRYRNPLEPGMLKKRDPGLKFNQWNFLRNIFIDSRTEEFMTDEEALRVLGGIRDKLGTNVRGLRNPALQSPSQFTESIAHLIAIEKPRLKPILVTESRIVRCLKTLFRLGGKIDKSI